MKELNLYILEKLKINKEDINNIIKLIKEKN